MSHEADSYLALVRAAIAERDRASSDASEDWGASATAAAIGASLRLEQTLGRELVADVVLPLSALVRAAAAETRMLIETDPALPGLERRFWIHYMELSPLLAIFARQQDKEYKTLCDSQAALSAIAFRDSVAEVWKLLRDGSARAPPPTRPPRTPPTDNAEYYFLRTKTETAKKQSTKLAAAKK